MPVKELIFLPDQKSSLLLGTEKSGAKPDQLLLVVLAKVVI
jgi:hypothetical protein